MPSADASSLSISYKIDAFTHIDLCGKRKFETQSEVGDEIGSLGELQFTSKGSKNSMLGWRSEKPEMWPYDGPDCEAGHLASYGVTNSMDLVRRLPQTN